MEHSEHDDAELVTVAALLQKLPPLPSVLNQSDPSSKSTSQSPRSNSNSRLNDTKSDTGKRKIVSCLDCHSRKVKCSKTRPVCEQCIKRGKQDTCVYELAEDDEEYERLPSTKRAQTAASRPSRPPKLRKTTLQARKSSSEQSTTGPTSNSTANTTANRSRRRSSDDYEPSIGVSSPATVSVIVASTSASSPKLQTPTPRRQDNLMQLDQEADLEARPAHHSVLGLCQSLLDLPDLAPSPSASQSIDSGSPLIPPGLANSLDPFLSFSKDTKDWGCPCPPADDVERLLNFYLSYTHELHPIFDAGRLRDLVLQLTQGSKEVRIKRQVGMAQVLLVLALGSRCAVVSEAWDELSLVHSARMKIAGATTISPGLIRAKALLSIYYLDTQRYADSYVVLGEAIAAARFLGLHLAEPDHPMLWNTLVRISLLHSVVTGVSQEMTLLPLTYPQEGPSTEPRLPELKDSGTCESAHSFARLLSSAVDLAHSGDPVRDGNHQRLQQQITSWAPLLTEHEIASSGPIHANGEQKGTGAPGGSNEDSASVFVRLHYAALSRLILLSIREPRASTTLGERDATSNARSEEFEEAMKDAREIVEACKMMKVYHDDFAASSGLLHLANAVASMVLCVYILRHPRSQISSLCKADLMRTTVMMYDAIEDDPMARMGYSALLRLRDHYEERRRGEEEADDDDSREMKSRQRSRNSRGGVELDGLAFVAGEALQGLRPTSNGHREESDGAGMASNSHKDSHSDHRPLSTSTRQPTANREPNAVSSREQTGFSHHNSRHVDDWSFSASMTFAEIDHITGHGGTERPWNDASWVGFLKSLYPIDGPLYGGRFDDDHALCTAIDMREEAHLPDEDNHMLLFDPSDSAAALALAPASAAAAAGLLLLSPHPHTLALRPLPEVDATVPVDNARTSDEKVPKNSNTEANGRADPTSNGLGLYDAPPTTSGGRPRRRISSASKTISDEYITDDVGLGHEQFRVDDDDAMKEEGEEDEELQDDKDGDWAE